MIIDSYDIRTAEIDLNQNYALSNTTIRKLRTVIVILRSGSNIGLGEATPLFKYSKETISSIKNCLSNLRLIGTEIESLDDVKELLSTKIFDENKFAKSAIEMSLFDIISRNQNVDFSYLVGSKKRSYIDLVGNIGILGERETLLEAEKFVDGSYKTLKLKIGLDIDKEIKRVEKVIDSFPEMNIRIDANQAYNFTQTKTLFNSLSTYGVELIEQPMPINNLQKYKNLRVQTSIPVMLDEDVNSIQNVKRIIDYKAADKIKSKLFKTGITETKEIVELCKKNDLDFIWGNGVQSHIGAFAECKTAMALNKINETCETVGPVKLKSNITNKEFLVNEGRFSDYPSVGLGIHLRDNYLT